LIPIHFILSTMKPDVIVASRHVFLMVGNPLTFNAEPRKGEGEAKGSERKKTSITVLSLLVIDRQRRGGGAKAD